MLTCLTAKATPVAKSQDTPIANPLIEKAVLQLEQANLWQQESNALILSANTIRKQLKQLRAAQHARAKKPMPEDAINVGKQTFEQKIQQLVGRLTQAQQQGAELRTKSQQLKQLAKTDFELALQQIWPQWLHNSQALNLADDLTASLAHNTRVRSVHKNMLAFGEGSPEAEVQAGMSLQVPALSKQNAPVDLNTSSFQFSRHEQYFAHIEVHNSASIPPDENKVLANTAAGEKTHTGAAPVPLNEIHQWRLMISDVRGNPVKDAEIEVQGHMPGHVHGLPTKPEVVQEIDPGVYLVDGLKFQMKGWWVMKFILRSPGDDAPQLDDDFFTFNLVL